jgi:hypothetical protein
MNQITLGEKKRSTQKKDKAYKKYREIYWSRAKRKNIDMRIRS